MKIENRESAVYTGSSRIMNMDGWHTGPVYTQHGIVHVYTQGDERHSKHTRLDIVWNGRTHSRSISGVRYTPRGLVTLAKRFAAEVAEDHK